MSIPLKRFLIVFGTRPEAIKFAPLIAELKQHSDQAETLVCVTGQHRQMLDQVLQFFEIKPNFDLNLMTENQTLAGLSSQILSSVTKVIRESKPDWILVQGDTTTTMMTSLAAFYEKIPVAHIEAGLRTGDKMAPWPEEVNRRLSSVLSELHFAPTKQSQQNLIEENIEAQKIFVTGNTVIDALHLTLKKIESDSVLKKKLEAQFQFLNPKKPCILVTGHRRENFGEGFKKICESIVQIAKNSDAEIVYPVHFNPNVRQPVMSLLGGINSVHLIEPLDYVSFVYLMSKCYFILTDSGGVQEEAPSLGKPVLVMREITERPEGVEAGTVRLVGTDPELIVKESIKLLNDREFYKRMSEAHNPYGDGHASERIVERLLRK